MDDAPKTFQPPYNISWATFLSVSERMAADPPNRVDRTYLDSQSGFIQTYLIAAYKAFGFIGEDARPTDLVKVEFADPDRRQGVIADLFRANYPTIIPLGETNSTHGELQEAFASAFPNITGQSRTKAIRFFLSGAEYAGIKTAPLWKTPKAPRGGSAPRRSRKASPVSTPNGAAPPAGGRVKTVEEMKADYFELLLKKAGSSDGDNEEDLLDRIERLVGIPADKKNDRDRKTAGSKPATPPSPASQGEG